MASNESSQPNLSQYFGTASEAAGSASNSNNANKEEFFDNFSKPPATNDSMMQSCRESGVDLSNLERQGKVNKPPPSEAEINISTQATDDERSLQRRQSQELKKDDQEMSQAFSNMSVTPRPTSLSSGPTPLLTNTAATPTTTPSNMSSSYATPVAPTPVTPIFSAEGLAYSTYAASPFNSNVPITSPLPMSSVGTPVSNDPNAGGSGAPEVPMIIEDEDNDLTPEQIRIRDFWIPSEAVQNSLLDRNVDRSMLTSAVVQGREEIQDPIRGMVLRYKGEAEAAKRNVLTADDVSQDINGLNRLINAGCLRAAVNLTARLLTRSPFSSQHSPASLRIWHVRIALLLKLKQFTTVEAEAAAFGNLENNVDLYYQYYPEQYGQNSQGSMVPFGFRVLLAELPLHVGKPLDAMDRLYALLALVEKISMSKGKVIMILQKSSISKLPIKKIKEYH